MDAEIKREFERLNKKLNQMVASKKETWVPVGWITDLTGWDNEKMRQARENNIIEFRRSDTGGWLYKLESLPEIFIKRKQAS